MIRPMTERAMCTATRLAPFATDGTHARRGPLGVLSPAVARALLVGVGTLAGLLLCELIVRLAGPALPASYSTRALQELHPVYGVFHRPGASAWLRDREFTTFVHFNRDGLRGQETPASSPDRQRILVLG